MSLLLLVACAPTSAVTPATPVPFIDEPAWLEDLLTHRPRIVMMHEGSIKDPAWQALVLRPRYRAAFLASETDTYETLLAREYTAAQRASDASWAQSLRDAQAAFERTPTVSPAGYDPDAYAGYAVGPELRLEPDGMVLDYKAFFEFVDFQKSLSAERYAGFVARLDTLGFHGDSKIDLRPGQVRFQYNNLIFHAASIDMARCAEAAGLEYFGAEVEHIGRGIDAQVGRKPRDWHQFLLTGKYGELPAVVRDFIEYRTPAADVSVCPNG